MSWTSDLRRSAIRRLPMAWQPAATYHYYRMRSLLEPELEILRRHIRPGDRAVDVGANEGVYMHAFAARRAEVEAFEPQPRCAEVLMAYARTHPNVRVHPYALGGVPGRATLRVPLRNGRPVDGHATLRHLDGGVEAYEVEVRTLDSYAFDRVAVVKIDVEGREADVIAGARDTFSRCRPLLLVEIEQRHLGAPITQVIGGILELGYAGEFLHPRLGRLPLDAFDVAEHQNAANADRLRAAYINNFIFTPRI